MFSILVLLVLFSFFQIFPCQRVLVHLKHWLQMLLLSWLMLLSLYTSRAWSSRCMSVHLCFVFVCLLAWIWALQNLYPTVRGHTATLLASGDSVIVCEIVWSLRLFESWYSQCQWVKATDVPSHRTDRRWRRGNQYKLKELKWALPPPRPLFLLTLSTITFI